MTAAVAVSVVLLNALLDSLAGLTLRPAVLPLPSQARAARETTPMKVLVVGTKRIRSLPASSKAAVDETLGTFVQIVPPFVEYCHVPLAVPDTLVMATPAVTSGLLS